jgi:nucleoside-diphosphate-sugar epimerase
VQQGEKMKILIAGSKGMIGSAVTRHLMDGGYEVVCLVRHAPGIGEIRWNPDDSQIDQASLAYAMVGQSQTKDS